MNTAVSLLQACRDHPGDFTCYRIAADFFDDPDEGNDPPLAAALRWMAQYERWPLYDEVFEDWNWYSDTQYSSVPHAVLPKPYYLYLAFGWGGYKRYYIYSAAIIDLANAIAYCGPLAPLALPSSPPTSPIS